jgi:hypothetical protein
VAIGVVLGYMGLLVFGAVISPGVGFFGHIVAMLPQIITEWSHAPAYGLLTWLLSSTLQRRGWPLFSAVSVAVAGAFVFGIWTEIFQASVPGRTTDVYDLLVNGVGIGAAAMFILWRANPTLTCETTVRTRPCTPIA